MSEIGNATVGGVPLLRCCKDMRISDCGFLNQTRCSQCKTISCGFFAWIRAKRWNALITMRDNQKKV